MSSKLDKSTITGNFFQMVARALDLMGVLRPQLTAVFQVSSVYFGKIRNFCDLFCCWLCCLSKSTIWIFAVQGICNGLSESHFSSDGTCIVKAWPRITWDQAFTSCKNNAPSGLSGRLVHIMTTDTLTWMEASFGGSFQNAWVGSRAVIGPVSNTFQATEWFWHNDMSTPGQDMTGLPYTVPATITAGTSKCLRMEWQGGGIKNSDCAVFFRSWCQYDRECRKFLLLLARSKFVHSNLRELNSSWHHNLPPCGLRVINFSVNFSLT